MPAEFAIDVFATYLSLPDVLKVRHISDHCNVDEIGGKFGGAVQSGNRLKPTRLCGIETTILCSREPA
jgi:hypothetical protein